MQKWLALVLLAANTPFPGLAFGKSGPRSKYASQEQREIKSLSPDDINELRRGGGWGLAKAAELNGFPGPAHLLELKDQIPLSLDQVAKISTIYQDMKLKAIVQGERLIKLERQLENLFRERTMSDETLHELLSEITNVRGQLRYTHLSTHLEASTILLERQIAQYNALRGYAKTPCARVPDMERRNMEEPGETQASFEETYPGYPFAGLVRLGIRLAECIVRRRRKEKNLCPMTRIGTLPPGSDLGVERAGLETRASSELAAPPKQMNARKRTDRRN